MNATTTTSTTTSSIPPPPPSTSPPPAADMTPQRRTETGTETATGRTPTHTPTERSPLLPKPQDSEGDEPVLHDAVFGDLEGGPDYRGVTAAGAFVLMTKANFGLGVLAVPSVFHTLGIVPGAAAIITIEAIYAWSASFIAPFKLNHPEVYSLADAAHVFGGPVGREAFNVIFIVFFVFCASAALVGLATALDTVTGQACNHAFVVGAAVVGFLISSIRTLSRVSWVGWAGLVSILTAVLTLTVAVLLQDRPGAAPDGPYDKDIRLFGNPSVAEAISALNVLLFSSASSPIYYGIISEMRNPTSFPTPMYACYTFLTTVYLTIGSAVYLACGQYVTSPALGSAGPFMRKVVYGIALPGLCASLVIFNHVSAKVIFVRALAGTRHLASNSPTHWITWLATTAATMAAAYIVATAIPMFSSLISLAGAAFAPVSAIAPMLLGWLHDHKWGRAEGLSRRVRAVAAINIALLVVCAVLTIAGVWAAVGQLDGKDERC